MGALTLSDVMEKLNRIERLMEAKPAPKRTWVKVGVIKQLTMWDKEFMRRARDSGMVKWRREDGSIEYLLESIDEKFIINKKDFKTD